MISLSINLDSVKGLEHVSIKLIATLQLLLLVNMLFVLRLLQCATEDIDLQSTDTVTLQAA